MKIEGNKIICQPGDEFTIKVVNSEPEPIPTPEPDPKPSSRMTFWLLIPEFNEVLTRNGYNGVVDGTDILIHLQWVNMFADREWDDENSEFFNSDNYPEVYNYYGDDCSTIDTAYNAMQAMIIAMYLAELCPTEGEITNTQTELFKLAFDLGGGMDAALYMGSTQKASPNFAREVAARIYAYTRGCECNEEIISKFRRELGGSTIPAGSWEDLGYVNTMLTDEYGRRGYQMDRLGFLVNTQLFIPAAPGPRIEGTTVCDLPLPLEEGQPDYQFNPNTQNYIVDEAVNDYMVSEWNMMSRTPLSEWESYSIEKKNRILDAVATVGCTYRYMFGASRNIQFNGILYKTYDGSTYEDYYCFEETSEDTGLRIDGPFSDLEGIYRYNVQDSQKTPAEKYIERFTEIADNSRFPTLDSNYGRCRPGCKATREGGEFNPIHGSAENELYNIDIMAIVADTEELKQKILHEEGFAADSPRSYVSGHSAQINALALLFGQMNPEKIHYYGKRAHDYSVNRSIARFHWNSDCIYGRLFGAMILPLINAMEGMLEGYEAVKEFVLNPHPVERDMTFNLIILNNSDRTLELNGELCFVLANPDVNGTYYGWEGAYNRTGHIRFCGGSLTVASGEMITFNNVSAENSEMIVRGRNFLDPDRLPECGRPSNVLLYNYEGNSEEFVPQCLDSNMILNDGDVYTLTIN